MYKEGTPDIPIFWELKRKEIYWEGKEYDLSFKTSHLADSLKDTVEEKLEAVREDLYVFYPHTSKDDAIENWMSEQANLLANAFWNDVHQNKDEIISNSILFNQSFYCRHCVEILKDRIPYVKIPTTAFEIHEGAPWIDGARLIAKTDSSSPINSESLYILEGIHGHPRVKDTPIRANYDWSFVSYFYRALRKNNLVYKNALKVTTDRFRFDLELL